MDNILEVQGLCKHYDGFELNNVSFVVPQGYIMGFIGPNGAGKTTTIKSILGMTQASGGIVTLFGESNTLEQNSRVGVVMDAPPYVHDWTVNDVELALSPFYKNWNREIFSSYLTKFSLSRKKLIKELSRGMKVKLQLAVALSHDAELLLLDEPTSGLDPIARDEICDLLRGFIEAENRSVFFSTHITTDLEKTADYITFIMQGRIVYTGTKDEILEKYVRVTGGLGDIGEAEHKHIIGYREHRTGFEGMADVDTIAAISKDVLVEPITLDEIIIYMNEGVRSNE